MTAGGEITRTAIPIHGGVLVAPEGDNPVGKPAQRALWVLVNNDSPLVADPLAGAEIGELLTYAYQDMQRAAALAMEAGASNELCATLLSQAGRMVKVREFLGLEAHLEVPIQVLDDNASAIVDRPALTVVDGGAR